MKYLECPYNTCSSATYARHFLLFLSLHIIYSFMTFSITIECTQNWIKCVIGLNFCLIQYLILYEKIPILFFTNIKVFARVSVTSKMKPNSIEKINQYSN